MGNESIFTIASRNFKINRQLLGNKGANLIDMHRLGLPIPEGIVLSSNIWREYKHRGNTLSEATWKQIFTKVSELEDQSTQTYSVRSGSRFSMPGMMDTILNIGLTKENLELFSQIHGERTALDGYRRLLERYIIDICGEDEDNIYQHLEAFVKLHGCKTPAELTITHLQELISKWEEYLINLNRQLPNTPKEQLKEAILAVLGSWDKPGAVDYRKVYGIPEDIGTGVVIQKMVFGNKDENSYTGVYFTRNPMTGENQVFGEVLSKAQGEDVVSGHFYPSPIKHFKNKEPKLYQELISIGKRLEKHYHKPQDIEFTIESGKLYILQTRSAKLTAKAVFQVANDMLESEEINLGEAVRLIDSSHIHDLVGDKLDLLPDEEAMIPQVQGIAASNGIATGRIALTKEALSLHKNNEDPSILIDNHIDPNDVETLFKSEGVITTKGGSASHMAIIMRAATTPGIVGCQNITINKQAKTITSNGTEYKEGEWITIDGETGKIYHKQLKVTRSKKLKIHEQKLLELRSERLGNSPWSAACYKTEKKYQRSQIIKKIRELTQQIKWKSTKAKVVQILNELISEQYMISSTVFTPKQTKEIKEELAKTINKGGENAPRTTHFPERLAGAPWAFGPNKLEDIQAFISGNWEGKYKGFKEWQDPDLESIIVSNEPVGKMDPDLSKDHFAFTISLVPGNPYRLIISISIGSPHLRLFEQTVQQDTIEISIGINNSSPNYLGAVSIKVGQDMLLKPSKELYTTFTGYQLSDLSSYIKQTAVVVINKIRQTVTNEWWNEPLTLPHLMCALDDELSLSVLEGQGRIKNGEVSWCLIYGAKGSEEKELVRESLKKTS